MLDAFRLGGWGMYPTMVAGLVLLGMAVQYARNPTAGRMRVIGSLRLLVLLTSCLGFVTGVIKTFTSVVPELAPDPGTIALIGVGESLHNIGAGLTILVLATLITTFGVAKTASRDGGAALHDPHQR